MAGPLPLLSLDAFQARLLGPATPAAVERLPLDEAPGLVLAELVRAPMPLPPAAIARRRGVAVEAAALVGASPYAPVMLTAPPPHVLPGDPLPVPADAVLPDDAVIAAGPLIEIGQAAYPGEGAILPGSDAASGAVLVAAGEVLTPTRLMALRLAGIATVQVHRLAIAIAAEDPADPAVAWLRTLLAEAGSSVVHEGPADLTILLAKDLSALARREPGLVVSGLALNPGGEIALGGDPARPILGLLPRFDCLAAIHVALLLPFIAAKTGRRLRSATRPLARKLVSQVGITDIALLRETATGYEPLTTGQITLSALLAADAAALIGPDAEGAAPGTSFAAIPLRCPFEPQ